MFSGLHLPRPLDAQVVTDFLDRLAADRTAPRLVMEARADSSGIRHLVGVRPTDMPAFRRLLNDSVPGSVLTKAATGNQVARPEVGIACRLRLASRSIPLLFDRPEPTTRAILSALSGAVRPNEVAVVQVVLGERHAPRLLPARTFDPDVSLLDAVTVGVRPASPDVKKRLQQRLSQGRFSATIRLGAASTDRKRRQRILMGLLSAISTAQAPGVHVHLVRQPSATINEARLPWYWPLRIGASELVGLLGWPLGDGDLPGMPAMHPKPLRAASTVHTGPRVFATSAAPGDTRHIGLSARDQMFHAVSYGPSGSGKTTVALRLINADIQAGHPVVVLDPKQQLIDNVLGLIPPHRINDVVILDASEPSPVGFNPLDVAGRDPDVVVDGILAVFESVFSDGWGPRSADIFSAALRTLARASTPERPATLLDLPKLLTDIPFRRRLTGRVSHDVALGGFWSWYENQSPAAQAAAISAPLNKLRQFLLRPALIRMLDQRGGRFRLRDTFRDNKIVLVPLNEGLIGPGTASLLGNLVIADVWQATQERANEPNAAANPGMIYIDESPRFLHLNVSLEDALAVSRSLSVGWFLAAQFRSQFPPGLRAAVDMNARSKIQFATEFEDARDTARLTRDLKTEDFLALPQYHAYVNLVANGHPSGWALVKTLPAPSPTIDPATVRAAVRANYPARQDPTPSSTVSAAPADGGTANPAPAAVTGPIGRKRRKR